MPCSADHSTAAALGQPAATGARGTSGSLHSPCPAIPAVLLQLLRLISAVEESAFEELHSNDGKNEHEEHVDYEDVEDILQGIHHAVKDSLGMGTRLGGCEEGRGHYPAPSIYLHVGVVTQHITHVWFRLAQNVWCMLAVGNNSGFLQLLLSWWVWCVTEFSGAARKIHQDREILVLSKYSHGQL